MRPRRSFGVCSHSSTLTTITAGMARVVCESCGRVSVHYVESAVQIFPDVERVFPGTVSRMAPDEATRGAASRYRKCRLCAQSAAFMVPDGLMCDEHAWQAAARLDWEESDPWVPIRIDKSNA